MEFISYPRKVQQKKEKLCLIIACLDENIKMKSRTNTFYRCEIEIKESILCYQLHPTRFLVKDKGTSPSWHSQAIIIILYLEKTFLTAFVVLSHFHSVIYTSVCFPQLNSCLLFWLLFFSFHDRMIGEASAKILNYMRYD